MRSFLAVGVAFLVGMAIAFAADPANAQGASWSMSDGYSGTSPSASYQVPTMSPTPHSAMQHHASTYHEGLGRGVAAIMKAVGEGEVAFAQARILNAEAEARQMQNEVIKSQTFVERRRLLEADRRERRRQQWEWLDEAREHRDERARSVLLQAYRVPGTELDRLTGEITWPALLCLPEFDDCRQRVELAYARLAHTGFESPERYGDSVAMAVDALRATVRSCRDRFEVEWDAYFDSQRFLVGLKYEAQFWGGAGGDRYAALAAR